MTEQSGVYEGVYEFEDPSGTMLAARVPASGPIDLYSGTKVIVQPNQVAIIVYQGKLADVFPSGSHELKTDNIPVITKLMNWRYGFQSPLVAEIWYFSTQVFTGIRWGTTAPIMATFSSGTVPLRAFGNMNLRITDPKQLYLNLIGTRSFYDVSQVEDFVQGHLLELLPQSLKIIHELSEMNGKQSDVARDLNEQLEERLKNWGITVQGLQVMSITPPQEVIEAMDEKLAMNIVGNSRDYLLYKTANSLDVLKEHANGDASQLMMGMMMSREIGSPAAAAGNQASPPPGLGQAAGGSFCEKCGGALSVTAQFCSHCGARIKA